jgi:hypothetical protein
MIRRPRGAFGSPQLLLEGEQVYLTDIPPPPEKHTGLERAKKVNPLNEPKKKSKYQR